MSGIPAAQEKFLQPTLNLRDLVLFNLTTIVSISSLSTAAKAGVGGLSLLLLTALFFFIPQGIAVNTLAEKYPAGGGIYAWTKRFLGDGHGFLCGWCYWVNNVLFLPSSVLATSVVATYALGQDKTGLSRDLWYVLPFTIIALWAAAFLNIIGLKKGRWLQNIGGVGTYLPFVLLAFFGIYLFNTQAPANSFSLSNWKPDWNLTYVNLWATIAFAYAGLELSSTLGSEIHNPRVNLPRSVFIAAILIALFYIVGAGALLYTIPRDQIDVIGGVFQGISLGADSFSSLWWLPLFAAGCATIGRIGNLGAWITGTARVAFMIGLDKYFPPAFARVHPRWKTPHVAIIIQTLLATLFLLLAVIGKGTSVETVFFTLLDMSIILYFIPYLYLFACFILQSTRTESVSTYQKVKAILTGTSGLIITLFALVAAVIPPPHSNALLFEIKVIGGSLLLLGMGGLIYRKGNTRATRNIRK